MCEITVLAGLNARAARSGGTDRVRTIIRELAMTGERLQDGAVTNQAHLPGYRIGNRQRGIGLKLQH